MPAPRGCLRENEIVTSGFRGNSWKCYKYCIDPRRVVVVGGGGVARNAKPAVGLHSALTPLRSTVESGRKSNQYICTQLSSISISELRPGQVGRQM